MRLTKTQQPIGSIEWNVGSKCPHCFYICHIIFVCYLLGKGRYVLGSVGLSVCLSVCLSVDNITQKVINGWDDILWRGPG